MIPAGPAPWTRWLAAFMPEPAGARRLALERLRACVGALLGVMMVGALGRVVVPSAEVPLLLAPVGASSVILFALPASPLAQPWSVIGGNAVSALVGVACARWVPDPLLAAMLAIGGAIAAMSALRCLHPPGGAVALSAVIGGPAIRAMGFGFAWVPVAVASACLVLVAVAYNNLTRHRYPHRLPKAADPGPAPASERLGFAPEDLDRALADYGEALDVSRDDLQALLLAAERRAHRRRLGAVRCVDAMRPDPASVEFGTPLPQAWSLLATTGQPLLPVVDRGRRLLGTLSRDDYLRAVQATDDAGRLPALRGLLRRITASHSETPEVAGQLMTPPPRCAQLSDPIEDWVTALSDEGREAVPVVDGSGRLCGLLTQADMIVALYQRGLGGRAA